MSAVKHSAVAASYCEVTKLDKDDNDKLNCAHVKDTLISDECDVRAQGVIDAAVPFSDTLLTLDNPSQTHRSTLLMHPHHPTIPSYYSPRKMGLLNPATSDGRVVFFLPRQGNTIAEHKHVPRSLVDHDCRQKGLFVLTDGQLSALSLRHSRRNARGVQ